MPRFWKLAFLASALGLLLPPLLAEIMPLANLNAMAQEDTDEVSASQMPHQMAVGQPELVATFREAMPTGVTVSKSGRIFVNFPRWGDRG